MSKRDCKIKKPEAMSALELWSYAAKLNISDHYKEAISLYQKIRRKSVNSLVADKGLGTLAMARGIRRDCNIRIGDGYFNMENYLSAVRWYRKYLEESAPGIYSNYSKSEARKLIAESKNMQEIKINDRQIKKYKTCGQWIKARPYIKKGIKKEPHRLWLLNSLFLSYYQVYEYKKSLSIISDLVQKHPEDIILSFNLGLNYRMLDQWEDAIKVFRKMYRIKTDSMIKRDSIMSRHHATRLKNDCCGNIGLSYYELSKKALAKRWLELHLENRGRKCPSEIKLSKIRKALNGLT